MGLRLISYFSFAAFGATGLATLHFSLLASQNLRGGIPQWKAWLRPVNADPALYSEVGNQYRRLREMYGWASFVFGLFAGLTRILM